MLTTQSLFSFKSGSTQLESLIKELSPRKVTGFLKITFDACDGIIILDEGTVVDGYEIFNDELLVKDRNGRHIVERFRAEPQHIDICEVQRETLHTFVQTIQGRPPQSFRTLINSLCRKKRGFTGMPKAPLLS